MYLKIKDLMATIEQLRIQIDELIKESSISDPKIIDKSQKLDKYIVEYYDLLKDIEKNTSTI